MGAIVECVPCGGLLEAGTVGLIGELPETGMTNNTALLSSYEFLLVYIAGNSPFNLRGHSYWRRAKALLIRHFHIDHKAPSMKDKNPLNCY